MRNIQVAGRWLRVPYDGPSSSALQVNGVPAMFDRDDEGGWAQVRRPDSPPRRVSLTVDGAEAGSWRWPG